MQNLNLIPREPLDPKTSKGGIIFIIIQNQNIHWYANSDPQHALCSVHNENIHSSSSLMYLQLHIESCWCIWEAPDEVSKISSTVATPLVKLGRYNQQKSCKVKYKVHFRQTHSPTPSKWEKKFEGWKKFSINLSFNRAIHPPIQHRPDHQPFRHYTFMLLFHLQLVDHVWVEAFREPRSLKSAARHWAPNWGCCHCKNLKTVHET